MMTTHGRSGLGRLLLGSMAESVLRGTTTPILAGVRATGLLLDGAPHDQIPRAARRNRADLIVIGTHGRTGLSKVLLGSVAERVIRSATCPVLTVRGR
jgi:nucleotide-binding universal stress UspA family protein